MLLGGGGAGEGSLSGPGGERTRASPPGPVSHSARRWGGRRGGGCESAAKRSMGWN